MKRLTVPAALILASFFLAACADPEPVRGPRNQTAYHADPPPPPADGGRRNPRPVDNDEPAPSDTASQPGPATGSTEPGNVAVGNLESGKPVAGKPGFVTSPYAPAAGYVDVRGFPTGTEVKDPYTGKIFLVP